MSARKLGVFRKPVTLSLLRQVEADIADKKVGELVVETRARYIPTEYDDLHISDKQGLRDRAQGQVWLAWCARADSRQKILRLENRRVARKLALSRKFYQFIDSPDDPDLYGDLNWED
jgi:hypothetical protein